MIKRIVLLLLIFILSLSMPALAAEAGSGMIEGRVVNGTAGSGSVNEQDVTLKTYLDNAEVDSATTITNTEGRFAFDGLSTSSGYSYQVTLTFQEAEYNSEWLGFAEGEASKSVEVTVYDSTTSDEALKVAIAHTFIYVEQGSLEVVEYSLVVNEADRTYIGSKEVAAGTRETLRFSLPEKASELQPGYGLMECCIYNREEGFVDTMPVLPGEKELVFSYRVDYNSGAYTFSRKVNYPITSYDLLVQGEAVQIASEQLTREEPVFIEETLFSHVSGSDFAPGDILVTNLSSLPETGNQKAIIWVVLTLVVLTGGFGFGYLLRRKRLQPLSSEGNLEQRRQRLLVELAKLDDDFAGGKIREESYRRLRAEKKAQLVTLMQRPKGNSG